MPTATSKKLYTLVHDGISHSVEKFTAPQMKRLENAKPVVFGDGLNNVSYNHDPAFGCEHVTISMIATLDDPFVRQMEDARQRHKDDPDSAEMAIIRAHRHNGEVITTLTLFKAVIQDIKYSEGDTAGHDNPMVEITFQPEDFQLGS
jgi:hypothetical protein